MQIGIPKLDPGSLGGLTHAVVFMFGADFEVMGALFQNEALLNFFTPHGPALFYLLGPGHVVAPHTFPAIHIRVFH